MSKLSLYYNQPSLELKIGELANLLISDVDLDREQVHVYQSKNKKDRYIIMSLHAIRSIKKTCYKRPQIKIKYKRELVLQFGTHTLTGRRFYHV